MGAGAFEAAQVGMSEFLEPDSVLAKAFCVEKLSIRVVELNNSLASVLEKYHSIGTDDGLEPSALTLYQSLEMDLNKYKAILTLKSFDEKARLFKEYERLCYEKECIECELKVAKTEVLIAHIKTL